MLKSRTICQAILWLAFAANLGRAEERTDYSPKARSRYERGQELLQKGQYREAGEAFDKAIQSGMEDFPRAPAGQARSALGLKDYDAAITRYTQFIERFGLERSCRH